jgi:uncharacterized membrane protein YjjB (DUF3815 family)
VVPFHHSVSVAALLWPTAIHLAVVQDTPARELLPALALGGVGWIDQPAASARPEVAPNAASVSSAAAVATVIQLARRRRAQQFEVSHRGLIPREFKGGFGLGQSKPSLLLL